MKFIPILFSTDMVQAILEDRKTMTRRIVKPQLTFNGVGNVNFSFKKHGGINVPIEDLNDPFVGILEDCPYGQPGDVLWVRETWFYNDDIAVPYAFKAYYNKEYQDRIKGHWKPSIHMPKEACRLFLKIKSIKVERLHDISEQDAIAEGIISQCLKLLPKECTVDDEKLTPPFTTRYKVYTVKNGWTDNPIGSFSSLWEKINGLKSLKANPWVWVIEFERIEKPENFK